MTDRSLFLEIAHRIGRRIASQALWAGNRCTWEVVTTNRSHSGERRALRVPAGGMIYQGTAGIALFLLELYRETRDSAIGRTAEGALHHALSEADRLPINSFGFYSGRVGIAFAAARAAHQLDSSDWLDQARRILMPLHGREHEDRGVDVVAGAAGAIPALLQLSDILDRRQLQEMAGALGEHLIRMARREIVGWSWDSRPPTAVRNLLGLAHGAAGMGHSLLELYHATGSTRYLYAAEQAFLYERQFFDKDVCNWPDFRVQTLITLLHDRRMEELRSLVREGKVPRYEWKDMVAWCHGAPGIGLTRLAAFARLSDDAYRREAEAAVMTTRANVDGTITNYSLCHGLGGNCETLIYAADVLADEGLRHSAETCGLKGWELFESKERAWPSGTAGGARDPSLMLGEAGIGYFYLRLVGRTPSVLLLTAPAGASDAGVTKPTHDTLQREYVDLYFHNTLQILDRSGVKSGRFTEMPLKIGGEKSDVEECHEKLTHFITDSSLANLREAFMVDKIRMDMTSNILDFTDEFMYTLGGEPGEDIEWARDTYQLTPNVMVINRKCTSDETEKVSGQCAVSEAAGDYVVLYRNENRIHIRPIGAFASLVLQGLDEALGVEELCLYVEELIDVNTDEDRASLRAKVLEQVRKGYRAGFIRALTSGDSTARRHKKHVPPAARDAIR